MLEDVSGSNLKLKAYILCQSDPLGFFISSVHNQKVRLEAICDVSLHYVPV